MKRVGLLTTFYEVESGFSLVTVADTQLRMLLEGGYSPVVIVREQFTPPTDPLSVWRPEQVDLRPVLPKFTLTDGIAPDFEARVEAIYLVLEQNLAEVDVCITHDIVLQNTYKEHNVAMRRYAATRPELLWLHWIHSCPSTTRILGYPHDCRFTPPPGYIVYPNDSDKSIVCLAYGLTGQEHRIKVSRAAHTIDPLAAWPYDSLTRKLVKAADLLGGEVVMIYPTRLDRGKQIEKVIMLAAGVQRAGYEARVLVCDWQSGGAHFQAYTDEMLGLAQDVDMAGKVHFSSRLDDSCNQGVPHKVVMELFDFSNVYAHPSRVETYSLTIHEAILRGNLVALNYDFPATRELFGEAGLYFDFSSDRAERTYHIAEEVFWRGEALRLIAELKQNRALWARTKARREWTPGALWREMETLLYLEPVA